MIQNKHGSTISYQQDFKKVYEDLHKVCEVTCNILSYNNTNSQLEATITNFIDNYYQLNMFRGIISPILRSTRLCLQLVVKCTGDAASRLLRMGEIIARNTLS